MKHKSEVLSTYRKWKSNIQAYFQLEPSKECITQSAIRYLWSDNGGEFVSAQFWDQLRLDGTQHETSAPDTPEQNGLAEQMNQTLITLTNAILEDSKLPKSFWADALTTATYIIAQSPTEGIKRNVPYEVLFGRHTNPTILQRFGCLAYALIPKTKRTRKFQPHARKTILIDYTNGQQVYKLLDIGK